MESPETWHPTVAAVLALPSKAPQSFKNAEANRLAVFRARCRDWHCAGPRECYVNPRAVDAYDAGITISRAVNRPDRLDDSVRRSRAPTTPEPFSSSWYVAKFAEDRRMVRPTRTLLILSVSCDDSRRRRGLLARRDRSLLHNGRSNISSRPPRYRARVCDSRSGRIAEPGLVPRIRNCRMLRCDLRVSQ
ncbi:hypothetical protein B0E55_05221 [Rhodococcus sp. 66b]|nr:hypothetical protein B0E55_05221 [Rhodococcus sp. 66b]